MREAQATAGIWIKDIQEKGMFALSTYDKMSGLDV